MRAGFIHTEFDYAWTMPQAYPYTDPRAYFSGTESIHGTIHHIPKALQCDKLPFRPDFDYSPYDIVIMYLQGGRPPKDIEYLRTIKSKYPKMVMVWWWGELYRFDQDFNLWFDHILKTEREMIRIVDVMTCEFHRYTGEFASVIKRRFNAEYRMLYSPTDLEDILKYHRKTTRDISKGIWTMVHGRNPDLSRSLTVMGRLQRNHPDLKCYVHLFNVSEDINEKNRIIELRNKITPNLKFEFSPTLEPHDAFMDFIKDRFFIIDDYPAYCGGSLSELTSCIGLPTITHDYNTAGYLCYPDLNFGMDDLDKWVEAGERLITDEDYYWKISRKAQELAQKYYSFDAVKKNIEKIYYEFRKP